MAGGVEDAPSVSIDSSLVGTEGTSDLYLYLLQFISCIVVCGSRNQVIYIDGAKEWVYKLRVLILVSFNVMFEGCIE